MSNQQTECLNDKCSKKVNDGIKWCSMECKKQFLFQNYSDRICDVWFKEADKDFKIKQDKVRAEIKASGLSVSEFVREFLLSIREFKDVDIKEKKGK